MKNTKKLVALLIVMALVLTSVFVLVACNNTTYKLTYALGDHAASSATAPAAKEELKEGDKVTLEAAPAAAFGYTFDKWSDGTNTYAAGAEFTMPASDVTLTATWTFTPSGTSAAYGYVHSNGVGKATVTITNGQLTDATLDEACVPTQVKAAEEDGEYTVKDGNNIFYKTVKWGGVTAVYDAEAKAYKVGEKLLINKGAEDSYFALTEEGALNAQIYFEAVANNKVTVLTSKNTRGDATIMTAEKLLKSKNGYWTVEAPALGWKGNVEKLLAYVKANGVGGTLEKDGTWKDGNGVDTGATWTDMNNYFNLFKKASANVENLVKVGAGEQVVAGEAKIDGLRTGHNYQAKVKVTVKDGVITAVELLDLDADYEWSTSDKYGDKASAQAWVNSAIVGKSVLTVMSWTVDVSAQSANALLGGEVFNFTAEEKTTKATETGARVIAAIQNALAKIA